MKGSSKKSCSPGPRKSPSIGSNPTKGVFKGSGGADGRATPPQINRKYKPKGNP
jgi:hypothetical protein